VLSLHSPQPSQGNAGPLGQFVVYHLFMAPNLGR